MEAVNHNNPHAQVHSTGSPAPHPMASPPVQHQDAGQIAHLPPTYDQARSNQGSHPGSPAPAGYQQQATYISPDGQQYGQQQQQHHIQQQQPTYLTNPTHNGNASDMGKHEPQLMPQQQGQPGQGQPGMVAAVVPLEHLDNNPQWIDCPWCQKRTHTRVEKEGTSMQMLTGVVLCLLCVCLACLPCIAGWFEDTHQFCSNCGKKVSTRSHEGHLQVFRPSQGFAVQSQFPQAQGGQPQYNQQQQQGQHGQQQGQQQAQQQPNPKVA